MSDSNEVILEAAKTAIKDINKNISTFMATVAKSAMTSEDDTDIPGDFMAGAFCGLIANVVINAIANTAAVLGDGDMEITEKIAADLFDDIGEKSSDGLEHFYAGDDSIQNISDE